MDDKYRKTLEEIKLARATGTARNKLHNKIHQLAESQYLPALDYFLSFLSDPDWDWRVEGVQMVGFHFEFSANSDVADRLRHLLLTDSSDLVRSSAALALGGRSKWPDSTLLRALQTEPDIDVGRAIFEALMQLAGVPFPGIRRTIEQMSNNHVKPDVKILQQVLREFKIDLHIESV